MNKTLLSVMLASILSAPSAWVLAADPTPTNDITSDKKDMTQDKVDIAKDKADLTKDIKDVKADQQTLVQDNQKVVADRQAMQAAKKTYAEDVKLYGANDPRTLAAKDAAKNAQEGFVSAVHTRNAAKQDLMSDRRDIHKDKVDLRKDRKDLRAPPACPIGCWLARSLPGAGPGGVPEGHGWFLWYSWILFGFLTSCTLLEDYLNQGL